MPSVPVIVNATAGTSQAVFFFFFYSPMTVELYSAWRRPVIVRCRHQLIMRLPANVPAAADGVRCSP